MATPKRQHSNREEETARRAAEEARLRVALGNMDIAVFHQDIDLRYTWVYQPQLVAPSTVLGRTDQDMLELLKLPGLARVIAFKRRVIATGVGERLELPLDAGPNPRWYEVAVEPLRSESGAVVGVTGSSLNITERRRGEEHLRALLARLQAIREEEKGRIARDLHDELGQLLTALNLRLQTLEKAVEKVDPDNVHGLIDRVVSASKLAKQTVTTVQRITGELRPDVLHRLGLLAAVERDLRLCSEHTGLQCRADLPESLPELGPKAATALYRICQEAMTNVCRHANASRLAVKMEVRARRLTLQVEDDGSGFDPAAVEGTLSLGLLGMRERARALDGEVRFAPRTGGGTVVKASIPLRSAHR